MDSTQLNPPLSDANPNCIIIPLFLYMSQVLYFDRSFYNFFFWSKATEHLTVPWALRSVTKKAHLSKTKQVIQHTTCTVGSM